MQRAHGQGGRRKRLSASGSLLNGNFERETQTLQEFLDCCHHFTAQKIVQLPNPQGIKQVLKGLDFLFACAQTQACHFLPSECASPQNRANT